MAQDPEIWEGKTFYRKNGGESMAHREVAKLSADQYEVTITGVGEGCAPPETLSWRDAAIIKAQREIAEQRARTAYINRPINSCFKDSKPVRKAKAVTREPVADGGDYDG